MVTDNNCLQRTLRAVGDNSAIIVAAAHANAVLRCVKVTSALGRPVTLHDAAICVAAISIDTVGAVAVTWLAHKAAPATT